MGLRDDCLDALRLTFANLRRQPFWSQDDTCAAIKNRKKAGLTVFGRRRRAWLCESNRLNCHIVAAPIVSWRTSVRQNGLRRVEKLAHSL